MKIDRLIKYMDYKRLNDNQVTVDCGLAVGLIGKARKGKSDLGRNSIEKILKVYRDLNRQWLVYGEGDMLIVPPTSTAEPQTHLNNMDNFTQLLQAIIRHGEEISEHRRLLDRAMSIVEQQQAERMPATSGVLATAVRDSQNPPPLRNESK